MNEVLREKGLVVGAGVGAGVGAVGPLRPKPKKN